MYSYFFCIIGGILIGRGAGPLGPPGYAYALLPVGMSNILTKKKY